MKTCKKCKVSKNENEFRLKGKYRCYLCKVCEGDYINSWQSIHKEHIKKTNKNWCESMQGKYINWKNGANRRRKEWNLTIEYLESLPLICHYTGERLTMERNRPNSVSLDRIDSKKGYIKGNVVFCRIDINRMKREFSKELFLELCAKVNKYNTKS